MWLVRPAVPSLLSKRPLAVSPYTVVLLVKPLLIPKNPSPTLILAIPTGKNSFIVIDSGCIKPGWISLAGVPPSAGGVYTRPPTLGLCRDTH